MRKCLSVLVPVLFAALLFSCSGNDATQIGKLVPDTVDTENSGADATAVEKEVAIDFGKGRGNEETFDFGKDDEVPIGAPCNDNDDCGFGYCIEGPEGQVCTHTCITECPQGWICKGVTLYGSDPEFICIPTFWDLCEPCSDAKECGDDGDQCIPIGGEGNYCGLSCVTGQDCPVNYECELTVDTMGVETQQCLPITSSCSCRPGNQGELQNCYVTNEWGTCPGEQVCLGVEGWSGCEAPPPSAEDCDGVDNDCNGAVDDGFADTDDDGMADCIDTDDDNDDILDGADNCPLDYNPGQYDLDEDDQGNACDLDDDGDGDPDELDCAPLEPLAHHGAAEVCDAVDNNCNGQVDEGYADTDLDGMADCVDPDDDNDGDLDDTDCGPKDDQVYNGALEACDGKDNDCNGKIDEGFKDTDGDGVADCWDVDTDNDGDPDISDCAPLDDTIFNGAAEACDGVDNNCNLQVDEGYADLDQDGLANCIDPDDDNDGDPDDTDCAPLDPKMFDGGQEVCDGIDNNCDNKVDEGYPNFDGDGEADCIDFDDDNDGDPDIVDCNQLDDEIHHGAEEVCDGQDNDCNLLVDEAGATGCSVFYKDKDDDGWGMTNKFQCVCGPTGEYTASQPGDCDDSTLSINPDGTEVCNNSDDDCDGVTDNEGSLGCESHYMDFDGDGYGSLEPACICWANNMYTTKNGGDCDEENPAIHPGAVEDCDGIDDNCDGQIDEGVGSTCGTCDPSCHQVAVGPEGDEAFSLDDENSSGLAADEDGNLLLDTEEIKLAFIWIANSGESTVSKLDTETGYEVGRYQSCSNPSRTSVDLYSDVWVACRNDGGVAKIVAYEKNCVDKNNDGIIQTSQDTNGDHKISGAEMLPKGQDECVKFIVYPGGSCQRAAGVDAENNAWIGEWNGQVIRKLNAEDGAVMQSISIGCNPYGLVVDGDGIVWVSGRGCGKLVRVDPETGQYQHLNPPTGNNYGITVDAKGRVWTGHYSSYGISRYNPENGQFDWITQSLNGHCPRGMAGSADGYMYSGLGCGGTSVARVDIDTLAVQIFSTGGANTPIGVAMDSEGYLWAVGYSSNSAAKIDTQNNMQVVGTYPVGANPYTYSDMTGYAAKNYTAPQGYYQHIIPGGPVGATNWTLLDVAVNYQGESYVKLRLRAADTVSALNQEPWQGPFGPFPPNVFPMDLTAIPDLNGKYLQVEVILIADEEGNSAILTGFTVQYHVN